MASPCPNVNIRPLDCDTDSITVCLEPGVAITGTFSDQLVAEDSPHVSGQLGRNIYGVRNDTNAVFTDANLDYTPISVDSTGAVKVVAGALPLVTEYKQPGVAGTPVAGSRWQQYVLGAVGTAPTLDSPIPTGAQRIIVDWILVNSLISAPLAVTVPQFTIVNTDGAPATVYWGAASSLPIVAGSALNIISPNVVVQGELGERLRIQQTAAIALLTTSLAWGGYIVNV